MNQPFFSLIIPCHNSKYIGRVFDSLTRQNISKDDIEIIVVDDNSDDKSYIDIIKSYDFNCIFTQTDTDIHCPGNTRRKGMEYVTGKWLCFCDHDDYFVDGSLAYIKGYIESVTDHTVYEVFTNIEYVKENGEVIFLGECNNAWLHGKWYNVDELIRPFGINFKENLYANEDCYFNCEVFNQLIEIGKDFDYLDVTTYRWVSNPESLSHSQADRGYLFENFNDFLYAVTEPYMKNAIETKDDRYIRHVISGYLFGYFYYEAADYFKDISEYQDVYEQLQTLLSRITNEIGLSDCDIVNYVYQDTTFYEKNMYDSFMFMGHFIPRTSFQDFVFQMSNRKSGDVIDFQNIFGGLLNQGNVEELIVNNQ